MMLQPVGLRRATSGEPSSSASSSYLSRAQLSAMTPPRSARVHQSHAAVLRVRPSGKGSSASTARVSQPLRAAPDGITIGTSAATAFYCFNDPMVSPEHGTLECTAKHGVWVYVDHSTHGTTLNGGRHLLHDAAVVRSGDRLLVGATEIELHFETPLLAAKEDERLTRHANGGVQQEVAPVPAGKGGIAPSPIEWTDGKLDAFKSERLKPLASKSFASATPPQHTASPAPGFNPRRKRHSMTAFTPMPSPPPTLGTASSTQFLFQRTRPLVPSAPSTPPRADATRRYSVAHISPHQQSPGQTRRASNQAEDGGPETADSGVSSASRTAKPALKGSAPPPPPPPPLGYSSSPVAGPLQRLPPQIPQSPSPRLAPQKQPQAQSATQSPQQRMSPAADQPKPKRDDLRRRVLKKMELDHLQENKRDGRPIPSTLQIPRSQTPRAASAASGGGVCSSPSPSLAVASSSAAAARTNNQLDFTPPSSPVAHKDILRQKESLLNILKHKYKEEQLLKQQQEEWMRHHFSLASPPVSPIKSSTKSASKTSNDDDDDDDDDGAGMSDLEIPPRAPVLLRTISLGIHQASPRLTAAVLASRSRFGSFEGKRSNQRSPETAANASHDSAEFSSVSSSVSTEPACHRRVTRSLSFSSREEEDDEDFTVRSPDDFMGYEDDDGSDGITSFSTHGFYASGDCKSARKDEEATFSAFYASPPGTLSSSSLVMTGSATKDDRFSIDIVTPREPEDDELLESPKRSSGAVAASLRPKRIADKTSASPNLFDKTQRRPLYKPARYSQSASPSGVSVSAAAGGGGSSPSAIRSSRRLPSPV